MENKKISNYLRQVGVLALVGSAAHFMLQGWSELTTLSRFLYFFSFTLILAFAGIFCGAKMKDEKGARTFLALATATLTVHFSQLGAMTLGLAGLDQNVLPHFILSRPISWTSLVIMFLAVSLIALPIARLGFTALTRPDAKEVTQQFFLLNLLMLIPTRNSSVMVGLLACEAALLHWIDRGYEKALAMRTPEGKIARLILVSPFLVLLGRTILYPAPMLIYGMIGIIASAILFFRTPTYFTDSAQVRILQSFFMWSAGLSWIIVASDLNNLLASFPVIQYTVISFPLFGIPLALSLVSQSGGLKTRLISCVGLFYLCLVGILSSQVGNYSVMSFLVGTGITLLGFSLKEKAPVYIGAATSSLGLLNLIRVIGSLCGESPWVSLAVLGISVLFLASHLERDHDKLRRLLQGFREKVSAFN